MHTSNTTPKFNPLGARVQFERIANPPPKKGQLVVATIEFRPSIRCRVISVGRQCEHVRPGMIVLIPLNCGMVVQNVTGRVCRESEILAIEETGKGARERVAAGKAF
jgi:hypothetical protein